MAMRIDIALLTGLVKDLRGTEAFAPAQVDMRNVRLTDAGNSVKRSGYATKWDTGTEYPIVALIPEEDGYAYTGNGKVFSLGLNVANVYSQGTPLVLRTPQWVRDKGRTIVTNGLKPLLLDGDAVTLLGGSPPSGKFIAKISSYTIISGYDDTEFSWSAPGNAENYPVENFANLQKTGTLLNMAEYKERLLFFKEKEVEVWNFVGGSTPFVRYPGGKLLQGLGAVDSVVQANDRVYWFGDEGDFYVYENGAASVISDKMRRRLDEMNNLSDMKGYDIRKENLIMWVNPTDGMTFLYDYSKNQWLEDSRWDNGWQALPFTAYMELNRKQYFGSRNLDGLIHEWSEDYKDDNGQPIRVYRRFKVGLSKAGNQARVDTLQLRREGAMATASIANPVVAVRYRFDAGPWSNWRQLTLGTVGKHDPFVEIHRLGMGREFEVEISATDNTDFIMTNAILDFQEMTS